MSKVKNKNATNIVDVNVNCQSQLFSIETQNGIIYFH